MKKKRRKKKRKLLAPILIFLLVIAAGAFVAVKVFTVKHVVVKGNERYEDEAIQEWVLNDEYSWNTLYVYLKYQFQEPAVIPFIDTMEISMKPPHTIEIQVYEKGLLGYVYLESLGQNAYFDKDGIVVETSSEVIEGLPRISGLSVDAVVLYEPLPLQDKQLLKNLLTLTQTLKKYEIVPEQIAYSEDKTYRLEYGSVEALLGSAQNVSDKVLRLSYILPKLEGMSGRLHLEGWTENTTDISFEKRE